MARFDNVKIGDLVLVSTRYSQSIATVERVTATQFVANGVRYTKYGRKVGESQSVWLPTNVQFATPELIERVQAENGYQRARSTLHGLNDQLLSALRIVDKAPDRLKRTVDLKDAAELLRRAVNILERLKELENNDN